MNGLPSSAAYDLVKTLLTSEAVKLRTGTNNPERAAQKDAKYLLTLIHLLQHPQDIPATTSE